MRQFYNKVTCELFLGLPQFFRIRLSSQWNRIGKKRDKGLGLTYQTNVDNLSSGVNVTRKVYVLSLRETYSENQRPQISSVPREVFVEIYLKA